MYVQLSKAGLSGTHRFAVAADLIHEFSPHDVFDQPDHNYIVRDCLVMRVEAYDKSEQEMDPAEVAKGGAAQGQAEPYELILE